MKLVLHLLGAIGVTPELAPTNTLAEAIDTTRIHRVAGRFVVWGRASFGVPAPGAPPQAGPLATPAIY